MNDSAVPKTATSSGVSQSRAFEELAANMHGYGRGRQNWDGDPAYDPRTPSTKRPRLPKGQYAGDQYLRRKSDGSLIVEPSQSVSVDTTYTGSPEEILALDAAKTQQQQDRFDFEREMQKVPGGRKPGGHSSNNSGRRRKEPYKPGSCERMDARVRRLAEDRFDEPTSEYNAEQFDQRCKVGRPKVFGTRVTERAYLFFKQNRELPAHELMELVARGCELSGLSEAEAAELVRCFVQDLSALGHSRQRESA